ncbi:hypothetical protein HW555_008975 [Spodoptera exigua]|uniref:Homeobox domain-containing protein n=1 Tax=Spodoptera exigua TaxID=7107 RepID=A0A835GC19_SPOEX|nr:hypothetical protein HW555_008975 [Spodoptera exigua]
MVNTSYEPQVQLEQGSEATAVPATQPQGEARQLLDYRSWLCMQPARWAKPQPSKPIPRKPKRVRTDFTTPQVNELETAYAKFRYLNQARRTQLANKLQLKEHTIKIWFQNRRMKEKRELAEARESFGEVYEAVPQRILPCYPSVAQTYPAETVPFAQNYSRYMHRDNVSPSNVQGSFEPHVLPDTQTVYPLIASQEVTSLGSTKEEIVRNLFLIEQQYLARHTNPSPTEDEHSSPYFNPEQSCMYGDTTPFATIPEQHYPTHSELNAYLKSEEDLSTAEQLIQNIPSNLMELPCDIYFEDVNIYYK